MEKNQTIQKPQKSFNFDNPNKVNEEDVGIECFINQIDEGFECIIKHRYSDFIVNEIDEDGKVVWLIQNEKEKKENEEKIQIESKEKIQIESKEKETKITENPNSNQIKISVSNNFELKFEDVEEIINTNFKGEILDEEDSNKLKELVHKYINRCVNNLILISLI